MAMFVVLSVRQQHNLLKALEKLEEDSNYRIPQPVKTDSSPALVSQNLTCPQHFRVTEV